MRDGVQKWGIAMKTMLLRSSAFLLVCTAASANAAGILDNYSVEWSTAITTREASSVTYNWDQKRLMVSNDEEAKGSNGNYYATFGEYNMDGTFRSTITINGCESIPDVDGKKRKCDPEGLTYIGDNTYVVASERIQDIFKVTSSSTENDRTYTSFATAPQISVGGDAKNEGLEGVAFDRVTGDYYGVKETNPQTVYKITNANWTSESATVTSLFDVSKLNLASLQDIAVLSNGVFGGTATGNNLLILSGSSKEILEVTKTGELLSTFSLSSFNSLINPVGGNPAYPDADGKFEGITLDELGNIYLVSDDGDGLKQSYMVKLKYNAPAVPEPATWALMIAGFGLTGGLVRRQQRQKAAIRFA